MEIVLISNNLYENRLSYTSSDNIDLKKLTRPLSIEGEKLARDISLCEVLDNVSAIYSSSFSGALGSAKYLAERYEKKVVIEEQFNDAKVGVLGNKNLAMIKFMQNHDFNIKLVDGESLFEVGNRIDDVICNIINLNCYNKVAIYTHKRCILAFLSKYTNVGYNLDDEIVLEYEDKVVYNEIDKDCDIVRLKVDNKSIVDIDIIDL